MVGIVLTLASCGGSHKRDPTPASPSAAVAQAAADFWQGLENKDAPRFCRSIVGKAGRKLVEVKPADCAADFREGAFAGVSPGGHFERVVKVSIHRSRADVTLRVRTGARTQELRMTLVHAFGRWRVPIPTPR